MKKANRVDWLVGDIWSGRYCKVNLIFILCKYVFQNYYTRKIKRRKLIILTVRVQKMMFFHFTLQV